jgi:hypothetical protein
VVTETPYGEGDRLRAGTVSFTGYSPFAGPREMLTTVEVARLYYLDTRSKVQIAAELGITRFKVARLLELARVGGIVRITVLEANVQP